MVNTRCLQTSCASSIAGAELPKGIRRQDPVQNAKRSQPHPKVVSCDTQRWANTHASAVEAVVVIANLVAFERSLFAVARLDGEGGDAH